MIFREDFNQYSHFPYRSFSALENCAKKYLICLCVSAIQSYVYFRSFYECASPFPFRTGFDCSTNTKWRITHLSKKVVPSSILVAASLQFATAAAAIEDAAARISDRYLPCREFRDRRGTGARVCKQIFHSCLRKQGSRLGDKVIFSREIQRGALRFAEWCVSRLSVFFLPSSLLHQRELRQKQAAPPMYFPSISVYFPR